MKMLSQEAQTALTLFRALRARRLAGEAIRKADETIEQIVSGVHQDDAEVIAQSTHSNVVVIETRKTKNQNITARQHEVLRYLIQGVSNKEIANRMNLGEGTVKVHVAGLMQKLGVKSRTAAAAKGLVILQNQAA
jgi:DNA-binding NarL/FixJ family response regulator